EILNLLEAYDLKSMGPFSSDYLHLFIEAKKLAFADRAKFYADPDFAMLPIKELISKEYAARQRKRIDPDKAALDVPAGDPRLAHGDTIYLTGDAPRIEPFGSPTPTGRAAAADGGTAAAESGIPEATLEALKRKGHRMTSAPGTFGGYQAILIDRKHGTLHGGSDPRKDGCAA